MLRSYINKDYSFAVESNIDKLFEFSTKLSLATIVGYTLNKTETYKNKQFDGHIFYVASKYEKQQYYRNLVKNILEGNDIDFLFLKGHTLAKYYDEEYLRISSDIDILVSKENYEKAKELIINNTDLIEYCYAENELTISNKYVQIDLQNKFTNNNSTHDILFEDVNIKDKNHELSNEYKYLYILVHAYKHLKECYINLFFLFDLYYINKLDLDREFINRKLEEVDLKKFNDINIKTINVLFNNEESNSIIDEYIEFLFNMSNSSGIENMVLVGNGNNNGKVGYIFRRIFPEYNNMCRMYPLVKENKLLLPIYYIKRLFERKKQGRTKQALKEIEVNSKIDKNKVSKIKDLYKEIGIE